MSAPDTGLAATFTNHDTTQAVICEARRKPGECQRVYPPGTPLHYLHGRDSNAGRGRAVCLSCLFYYQNKGSTVSRVTVTAEEHQQHQQEIRKDNAHANRGDPITPTAHVGLSMGPPPVPHLRLQSASASNHHSFSANANSSSSMRTLQSRLNASGNILGLALGPAIQLPGRSIPMPSLVSSPAAAVNASGSGYTANHLDYEQVRLRMAAQAYVEHGGHVIVVEIRAAHMPPGRATFVQIDDLIKCIPNVPVHVGAKELKEDIVWPHLRALWHEYSGGKYPLTIDDFLMKDKENVEITPGIPVDRDVISQRYFGPKVKNGPKVFKGGRKFVIFAHLPNRVYMPYVAIREKEAEEAEYQRLVASGSGNGNGIINPSSSSKGVGKGKGKGKGKRSVSVTSADNEEWVSTSGATTSNVATTSTNNDANFFVPPIELPKTPTRPRKSARLSLTSPDHADLSNALRAQVIPKRKDVRSLFDQKAISAVVYLGVHMDLDKLIANSKTPRDDKQHPLSAHFLDQKHPQSVMLHLDLSKDHTMKGGFKLAHPGSSNPPLFRSQDICAKETYYVKEKEQQSVAGQPAKPIRQNIPHDGEYQLCYLILELKCLIWGSALLKLVYAFIDKFLEGEQLHIDSLPVKVPVMRFVSAGIAVEQLSAGSGSGANRVFLVEESIGGGTEGKFRKYMSNVLTQSFAFQDEEDQNTADFLKFSQHVQYWKTKGLAFVSDYQGGRTLLTDPQVMTDPSLGYIFANGNLPDVHETFETTHVCNKFCAFFRLPDKYPKPTDSEDDEYAGEGEDGVQSMMISAATHATAQPSSQSPYSPPPTQT